MREDHQSRLVRVERQENKRAPLVHAILRAP